MVQNKRDLHLKNKRDLVGAVFAEFLATAIFVWVGCGAAVSSNKWSTSSANDFGTANMLGIASAFGLGISVLAYGIGHVSGGHINPAVTFSFIIRGEMRVVSGILYIVAQMVGAIFGALFLWSTIASLTYPCGTDDESTVVSSAVCKASCDSNGENCGAAFGLGANQLSPNVTVMCAFMGELIGTFLLVFTVLMSAVHPQNGSGPNAAPIAIGWSVLLAHLVLIPLTGCGINPARVFGPAVGASLSGTNTWTRGAWVYYVAPFVGSAFATGAYEIIFKRVPTEEPAKEPSDDNEAPAESALQS
uniref:Aquaporin n=1 Tax=Helicotheca tamesis TaxID=374047 RepID=A0A7S2H6Q3_9STRA|mmetsp:Transcript_15676/g.21481  ORF Transcript_15676/g.21481 Transcript_15676/m.21481 type:complete len:303 (+) Transcript_15676:62-970(+)|eukprot:CAMPEP_0185727886 /NCGR_PEP_ID=MMETSP1171-20130828/3439_1 /TAXON_ID=374046 /ORGANISM="Helicotheca tamensis, Strain CCMP826" /LENGTH=302 /DNA_ID=CAMNT_0028396531 /DNA_START=37 /DNA_END=945 /DNA_ORIENTATION=-